jgi:hypothetical protein
MLDETKESNFVIFLLSSQVLHLITLNDAEEKQLKNELTRCPLPTSKLVMSPGVSDDSWEP